MIAQTFLLLQTTMIAQTLSIGGEGGIWDETKMFGFSVCDATKTFPAFMETDNSYPLNSSITQKAVMPCDEEGDHWTNASYLLLDQIKYEGDKL